MEVVIHYILRCKIKELLALNYVRTLLFFVIVRMNGRNLTNSEKLCNRNEHIDALQYQPRVCQYQYC